MDISFLIRPIKNGFIVEVRQESDELVDFSGEYYFETFTAALDYLQAVGRKIKQL